MQTVLIAANPKSGNTNRQALVEELARLLQQRGFDASIVTDLNQLESLSRELFSQGHLQAVVAAGGDGTISAVLTRIPPLCPIALLPLGSENLLAKHYKIPRDPAACADSIAHNQPVTLDAMQVSNTHLARPIIATLMASVGFDSDVVRLVHLNRKSHITRWAYRIQTICSWLTYRWPTLSLRARPSQNTLPRSTQSSGDQLIDANELVTYRAHWLFIFNVPEYATDLRILHDANPYDGLLSVGFFKKSGPVRGLFQYLAVLSRTHRKRSDWTEIQTDELTIDYADSARNQDAIASLQVDGDWMGSLPTTIKIIPDRIKLLT